MEEVAPASVYCCYCVRPNKKHQLIFICYCLFLKFKMATNFLFIAVVQVS